MRARGVAAALAAVAALALASSDAGAVPLADVNPYVGTREAAADFGTGGGAGNTFPGATAPFGMLQWSPDSFPSIGNYVGGYSWGDTTLRGFALTHTSGAGCAAREDFPILPTTAAIGPSPAVKDSSDTDPSYLAHFAHRDESASPGAYGVRLASGTRVQLAALARSGVGRFTFPASAHASILMNAGDSALANGDASVRVDPTAREVTGAAESGSFCYQPERYHVYFAARFSRAFGAYGTWRRQALTRAGRTASDHQPDPRNYTRIAGGPLKEKGDPSNTAQAGAYVTWDTRANRAVEMRVGISYVSVAEARRNLAAEAGSRSYATVTRASRAAWTSVLGRISVGGGTHAARRTFATALYHSLIAPTTFGDADGSYRGMDGKVHVAHGYTPVTDVSGWDVYRTQVPLLAALFPRRGDDLVRSLLANQRESGQLPKWAYAGQQTGVMVGDPADPMIAGARAFGATGFSLKAALAATRHGAEVPGLSRDRHYAERQGLADYLRLGYVPADLEGLNSGAATIVNPLNVWGSAATTLEYGLADFSIARLAAAAKEPRVAARYLRRSAGWQKLFRKGYIRPRKRNGAFPAYKPASGAGFVEGNGAQYTWLVPQDVGGLVRSMGGRTAATRRLDAFFTGNLNAGPDSPHAFLGNEPTLQTPWLYLWTGRPARTQAVAARAVRTLWDDGPGGLAGNDDLGALSAWYVWASLGMFPVTPGTDVVGLSSPRFPRITLRLPHGTVRITAPGASPGRYYVRGLRVGGSAATRPWLRFGALARGATLRFTLAGRPSAWGGGAGAAPPSYPAR